MLCIYPLIIIAQNNRKDLTYYLSKYNMSSHFVELIDAGKLKQLVSDHKSGVSLVVIFTYTCGGTPFAYTEVKKLKEKYKESLNVLMCYSNNYNKLDYLAILHNKFGMSIDKYYVIDEAAYKSKKMDDRHKGYMFRNAICEPCKNDVIGVPYYILFDSNNRALFNGYPSKVNLDSTISTFLN